MKKNNEPSGLYEQIYEGEQKKRIEQAKREAQREETARRNAARGRRRTAFRVLTTSFLVIAVFVLLVTVIYKLFFRISDMNLVGSEHYDAETVFSVAGVKKGDNLFSFSSRVALEKLKERCPYVKDLTVKREIPDKITFTVEEYKARFYAYIYDRTFILADDMTLIEIRPGKETLEELCFVRLPPTKEAICGRKPVFRNEIDEKHVFRTIDSVLSSVLADRIGAILFNDSYSLMMECDRKYLMVFGGYSESDIKLHVASEVMKQDIFKTGNKIRVDLTKTSETLVTVDNTLTFH